MTEISRRDFIATTAALTAMGAAGLAQDAAVYDVHEWGVVTVPYRHPDASLRSFGSRAEKGIEIEEKLPDFVVTYPEQFAATVESWKNRPVRKPVLYFHAEERVDLSLRVKIPTGRPVAWFPPAADYGPQPQFPFGLHKPGAGPKIPKPEDMPRKDGWLAWSRLELHPSVKLDLPEAEGWWSTARRPSCAYVQHLGGWERFVFYDALAGYDPKVELDWTETGVKITNRSGRTYAHVFVLRVRKGTCSAAHAKALADGATVELRPIEGDPEGLAGAFEAAGLNRDEAQAVVEIWTPEWLRADGARVLCFVPRATYDEFLPIELAPAPRKLERVLVAHVECLDPALEADVRRWIADLSNDSLDVRDEAAQRLRKLGPLAHDAIRRAADAAADPDVQGRLLDLLK